MKKSILAGILMLAVTGSSPAFAQTNTDDVALLKQRVDQLEIQVQEMSRLLEPMKAQQAIDSRRKALRENFDKKAAQDAKKYSREQLAEAEQLYMVANQKWGSSEANESLKKMISKYPDVNRTGCAVLYLAQNATGDERAKDLQDCVDKYGDCFYGDGVQVGAYARYLLAGDLRAKGEKEKAETLENEIKTQYANAVDHGGKLLVEVLKANQK